MSKSVRPEVPRHADPWSFRPRAGHVGAPAADLRGQSLPIAYYRRNGVLACSNSEDVSVRVHAPVPQLRSSVAELRRRQSACFARYRMGGCCTAVELWTIEALWFGGVSLRDLARRDGVSAAAISDRIARLMHKAPEFWNWWRLKHRTRRRADVW
jgi:hypothetical protein